VQTVHQRGMTAHILAATVFILHQL
jgi:hypothetical protein